MKSHVQDGEVVGLQADPSEPAPLEVRVVRLLPMEVLTPNHVPCPVSPSLNCMENCTWLCSGLSWLCRLPSCVLGGSQPPHPFNRVSRSHWERIASWLLSGCSPWEPSVTAEGWQDFGGGRQGMRQALRPASLPNGALLGLGLGSPWRKGTPCQSCAGILSQLVGMRITEAP